MRKGRRNRHERMAKSSPCEMGLQVPFGIRTKVPEKVIFGKVRRWRSRQAVPVRRMSLYGSDFHNSGFQETVSGGESILKIVTQPFGRHFHL